MRKLFYLFGLLLYNGFSLLAQTPQEGLKYMETERFLKAKKVFSTNYSQNPSAENAYYLGNFYYNVGKSDSAALYFNEGVSKDANNAWNYVGLGKIASNSSVAKSNFDKAIQITKSKNPQVLTSIAQFYILTDKLEVPQAFSMLDEAAKLAPKDPEIAIARGDGFIKIGDPSKAAKVYEEALKLNPQYPKSLMRLGDIYQRVFNYDLSLDYYKKALAADSQYAPVYREMGDVFYKKKDNDKAFANYKKYVSLADPDENTAIRYSSFLLMTKDYKKALAVVQPYENKEKVNPIIYRLLAYNYYELGQYDKGLTSMNDFWNKADKAKYISGDYEYYGKLLMKNNKDSLAVGNLEKALELDSSRTELYADLANAYMNLKKYDKAETLLEKKIKKKSTTLDLYALGKAYYYNKKYEKADTTFGTLISFVPDYPQGYLWRAKSNANLDPDTKKGLAKPYYEKFISLTQNEPEKNKKELINAYEYLGYYFLLKNDKASAKESYLKIKAIDPGNKKAEDGLKIVNAK